MEVPKDCQYTKEHEWARSDGDLVTVGITDHAQQKLGDIVYLELPEVNTAVEAGEAFGVIESVKAASDLYAPISGTVAEVHEDLLEDPKIVNQDPYGDGWMIKIEPLDNSEELLSPEEYEEWVQEEEDK